MSFFRNVVWFAKGMREYTRSGYEKASRSFSPADLEVDVGHLSIMVTGANSGLGKSMAVTLAKMGATVHMVCRNRLRGQQALTEVQQASGNPNVFLHELDISRPRDVVSFAQSFEESGKPLHVLINNAGVLLTEKERQFTPEDVEVTFATNSLGTHVMTKSFIPILSKQEHPRVVIVTSGGMLVQKLNVGDLQFAQLKPFDGTMAYAQTKRQQVIMTDHYSKRWPNVHFSCMHPGWADTPGVQTSIPDFHSKMQGRLRTVEQGADCAVWLAVSPRATSHPSGLFFQDRKPVSAHLPLAWTRSDAQDDEKLMKTLDDMATDLTK